MFYPVFNQNNRSIALPLTGISIASGLLIGLLSAIGYPTSAQPLTVHSRSQQKTENTNSIVRRLSGQWRTKVTANTSLTLIFAPDSKLFIVLPSNSNTAPATQVRYRIANSTGSPMQIDLTTSDNKTTPTIFEFTADGKLRMQLNDVNPDLPRPTAFKANAMVFDKISNATTLPANTRLMQPATGPQR